MSADTRYNESSLIDNGLTTQALFGGGLGLPPVWTTLGANVKAWLVTPTSANLLSAVATTSTGTGALVFATSPTFTTSIIAGSPTMALLNTTATTVNAFGAATNIVMGGATTTGTTTTSGLAMTFNSLTYGTGVYITTNAASMSSGAKLLDIVMTGNGPGSGSMSAANVTLSGTNSFSSITTTGQTISNTRTGTSSTNIALTLTASGGSTSTALNVTAGGVVIGTSGTAILKVLSATATLDFGSTAAGAVSDLTITVTGAALNDVVILGAPNGSVPAAGTFFAWVSATNTVKVRFANNALVTSYDPASGTYRVTVIQH